MSEQAGPVGGAESHDADAAPPHAGAPARAERSAGTTASAGEEPSAGVDASSADANAAAGVEGADGTDGAPGTDAAVDTDGTAVDTDGTAVEGGGSGSTWAPPRRFSLTRDTARPEGGGRAAPGDAPAPARQWPLLTVLCTAGIGLLIVGTDPFDESFRYGSMLVGIALLAGAVLRWVVPSVGMLAVRSRFTDLVTYGLMGTLIVLIALMAQPKPWLSVPFLQDVVHFTIR